MAEGRRVAVHLLDYGAGNIRSVRRALERCGADVVVSSQVGGDKLVVPGVGAFGEARRRLAPVWADLQAWVRDDRPTLGICLGMQLLFERSREHGVHDGLAVFQGDVVSIADTPDASGEPNAALVPHMGWQVLNGEGDPAVYFAHSFAAPAGPHTTATVDHGGTWSAIVRKGRITGFQFHPEKSGDDGLALLKAWVVA